MERENSFMRTKPVFPLLVSMSVPMMLSMLIQSLYNIVDSIYVSRLGTDALTAVSLAYPLQNAIVSVGVGIGVGISSAVSSSSLQGFSSPVRSCICLQMILIS